VLEKLLESGGEVRLAEEEADLWLRALTDVRLALGTRLGIDDDTDIEAELDEAVGRDPRSPRVGQLSVYAYLSFLQESLVGALMDWPFSGGSPGCPRAIPGARGARQRRTLGR